MADPKNIKSSEWRLYHVSFGQPPITKLIHSWNILTDDVSILADKFDLISFKSLKKGVLDEIWQKTNVLHPRNLLQAILSDCSMRYIRRELKKDSGIYLSPEDILAGVRRLLNEKALTELEGISITFAAKKTKRQKRTSKEQSEAVNKHKEKFTTSKDTEGFVSSTNVTTPHFLVININDY